jgi:alginate O-acetyltransferase complex protein AlgI
MQFHSFQFIFLFLPAVLVGYALLGRVSASAAKGGLIVASLFFYFSSDARALAVLLASILFNYQIALRLDPGKDSNGRWLKFALIVNLSALGLFKYFDFTAANIGAALGRQWSPAALLLPLGISFFTVQQIMFLVDRREGLATRPALLDYALFVSWFPYIVAGPITRWRDVVPQLPKGKTGLHAENISRGLSLFVMGLGKKVLLSSAFAKLADAGFAHPRDLGLFGAWLAPAAFALQLYYDFSGYTDMGRGAALMLNVTLPENFNNPFRALSVTEFWQRWHITLTNFITNYIYTPILRARRPTFRRSIVATVAAMTLAGIWHGAGWGFALFGLWHGIGLAANAACRRYKRQMPVAIAWCLTCAFLLVGFAFFRAHTPGDAWIVIRSMFVPGRLSGPAFLAMIADRAPGHLIAMAAAIALLFLPDTSSQVAAQSALRPRLAVALAACLFLCLIEMNSQPTVGFIYRQF